MLTIGVTGHRTIDDLDEVTSTLERVLDRLEGAGGEVQSIEVRSALAQGADRLVVEQILQRRDARLVAVLPLTPADYETDFEPEGQVVFARLLERAHEILVVDAVSSREEAYELAGQTIVETSDVLVALWDGGPSRGRGGTAEIVRYARDRQVPVEVVTVNGRRS